LIAALASYVPAGSAVVSNVSMPSPSGSWSQDRRHPGSQSAGQPSSDWKLPGAIAMTLLMLSVTQCVRCE